MKKTTLFLTALMMAFAVAARPYIPMADSTYITPDDTTTIVPPSEDDVLPDIPPYDEPDTLAQKEFSLNIEEVELRVGETFQIEFTWHYPDWVSAYGKFVTYSSGTDVVSVDDKGLITARRMGETYVYVSGNGVTRMCHVRVVEGAPNVVQHQKGRMALSLGKFLGDQGNDFEVTLIDGTLRLTGSFWGNACIPSELEYEILDGTAYFSIHTNYEDSTCTDGWQGSSFVCQTIDVSFENCNSVVYRVYVDNVSQDVTYRETQLAIVYRATANRYGTDANVDLNKTGEMQKLTAVVGEDSISISGYYLSNCASDLYCVAEEHDGSVSLEFYEYGSGEIANCVDYHYVNFAIPSLKKEINDIYIWQSIIQERQLVEVIVSSISSVVTADATPYYDLQGRKITHPTRGIYIKDGRKVAIK